MLRWSVFLPDVPANATLSVSNTGRDFSIGSPDGIYIVDLEKPNKAQRFIPLPLDKKPHSIKCQWSTSKSQPGQLAVTAGESIMLFEASLAYPHCLKTSFEAHDRAITDIQWSKLDGNLLASCGNCGFVNLWDIRCLDYATRKPVRSFCGWNGSVKQLAWNNFDGNLLASSNNDRALVWDIRKGSVPVANIREPCFRIESISWSYTKENIILVHGADSCLNVYDVFNPDAAKISSAGSFESSKAAFIPFGAAVACSSLKEHFSIQLFNEDNLNEPFHQIVNEEIAGCLDFVWRPLVVRSEEGSQKNRVEMITWDKAGSLRGWEFDVSLFKGIECMDSPRMTESGTSRSFANVDEISSVHEDDQLPLSFLLEPASDDSSIGNHELIYSKQEKSIRLKQSRSSDLSEISHKGHKMPFRRRSHAILNNRLSELEAEAGVDLTEQSNDLRKIPYPRTCGAFFSTDKIVCFFNRNSASGRNSSDTKSKTVPRSLENYAHITRLLDNDYNNNDLNFKSAGSSVVDLDLEDELNMWKQRAPTSPNSLNSVASYQSSFMVDQSMSKLKDNDKSTGIVMIKRLPYDLIKLNENLAQEYLLMSDSIDECLKANIRISSKYGLRDVSVLWKLIHVILAEKSECPVQEEVVSSHVPKRFRRKINIQKKTRNYDPFETDVFNSICEKLQTTSNFQTLSTILAVHNCFLNSTSLTDVATGAASPTVIPESLASLFGIDPRKEEISRIGRDTLNLSDAIIDKITWFEELLGNLLLRWGLPQKHAELMKFSHTKTRDNSLQLNRRCQFCQKELSYSQVCLSCRRQAVSCSVCGIPSKGISLHCFLCGHGGHYEHIKNWFMQEVSCPKGCGCNCVFE